MGLGEDLEGQAEGLCSAIILHLNQAGLHCGGAGQGLPTPGPALYPKTNYECVPLPRELCGGCVCRYVELQLCQGLWGKACSPQGPHSLIQNQAEDTTVWDGQLQFRGGGRLVLLWGWRQLPR